MKAISRRYKNSKSAMRDSGLQASGSRSIWPALLAVGGSCSLLTSVNAVELGDIEIRSALNEPLRASISYALQPNERIESHCIYLGPGRSANGVPGIVDATVRLTASTISVTGTSAVKEPLVALQVTVNCPATAHIRRDYFVFIDPSRPEQAKPLSAPSYPAVDRTEAERSTREARPPRRQAAVVASSRYAVQPGDSLSGIAAGISDRNVGLWQAVDAIFAANPAAFIDNNPDLLRAGAVLAIPDSIRAAQVAALPAASEGSQTAAIEQPAVEESAGDIPDRNASSSTVYSAQQSLAPTTAAVTPAAGDASAEAARNDVADAALPPATLSPSQDAASASDYPFVSPAEPAPATRSFASGTAQPPVTRDVQNGPATATRQNGAAGMTNSWSWLIWLGGSGVAIILVLLTFGQQLKGRFSQMLRRRSAFDRRRRHETALFDADAAETTAVELPAAPKTGADRFLNDSWATDSNIEVAEEFNFSDSGDFDAGFKKEAPQKSLLDDRAPPTPEETADYDVSMILDVTKQAIDAPEASTRDLRAIEIEAGDEDDTSITATLDADMDYKILEQDYENELTATQALNAEIAAAARELTLKYDKAQTGETTASPEAGGDDWNDDETLALTFSDMEAIATADTVEMPSSSPREDLDSTDINEALVTPAAENDATVELKSRSLRERKRKVSGS